MLVGEIDCVTAPGLRLELAAAIDESEGAVIVDVALAPRRWTAPASYTLLMGALKTSWAQGSICLAGPSGAVRQALARAQVPAVLPIYDTVNDAAAALSARTTAAKAEDGAPAPPAGRRPQRRETAP
jgi:anti-anti-sigma regulatory factor